MSEEANNKMRSIRRCFTIMELFDDKRCPMSATEIARELDAPLSSIVDLLKSVSGLGYIAYDSRKRTYFTTPRLGLLGSWQNTNPINQINYEDIMNEIHAKTNETISVFLQNDIEMNCISTMAGTHAILFSLSENSKLPIFGTAVGSALLAKWEDADIEKLMQRVSRKSKSRISKNQKEKWIDAIESARSKGYAAAYDAVIPEAGAIATAVAAPGNQWVVFSIGGLSKRIKKEESKFAKILIDASSKGR